MRNALVCYNKHTRLFRYLLLHKNVKVMHLAKSGADIVPAYLGDYGFKLSPPTVKNLNCMKIGPNSTHTPQLKI